MRVRVGLFGLFLQLVAGPGAGPGAHGTTDDGARRTSHRTTEYRTTDGAGGTPGAGSGFLIAFSGLTGHSPTCRSDRTANGGAYGTADEAPNDRAAHSACRAADRLASMLLVIRGSAIRIKLGVAIQLGVAHFVISPGVVHGLGSLS